MTGQLSLLDWMPEAVPHQVTNDQDDDLAEFFWDNASPGVRGHITAGGNSIAFIKSAYGTSGGTAWHKGKSDSIIHYDGKGVRAIISGVRYDISWQRYTDLMQSYAKKNKGWRK